MRREAEDFAVRVHRPVFRAPQHTATIDEVIELAGTAFESGLVPKAAARVMRSTGVETRAFVRPAKELFTVGSGPALWRETVELMAALAHDAAVSALAAAQLAPEDVDALVVTSVTGWVMPGVDARLIHSLGLRPTVRRLPVATIGCAGGLFGLVRAREQIAVEPGARILVVAAEAFSISFQPGNISMPAMIYKALGGDGVAAAVVTDTDDVRPGPAVELSDPLELLVPDTAEDYRLTVDEPTGHIGFTSTAEAPYAILKAAPHLSPWLGRRPTPPAFVVAHHGGPAILERTASVLDCDRETLRHSWDSLREWGNMSSVSVLDVLARTLDDPAGPQPGEEGLMLSIGPGVTIEAARLRCVEAPATVDGGSNFNNGVFSKHD
ncbi:PhlD [Streptacidiphilus pinicola]|uniref:PhlD n=1 Tax=Streptacidiphilus pinicola TaxID=2219663 RepID=A0A2X0KKM8_9ACTN|nr:3-oxoacyl-[acyl-carrier-protein] synthase III C-terminal domain-containing protein [Streptacidiphilus pinicola]RAG87240.1 PhlD [Streptacidiphilus pinicola]